MHSDAQCILMALLSTFNTASQKSELPLHVQSPLKKKKKSDNIKPASPQYENLCDPRQHINPSAVRYAVQWSTEMLHLRHVYLNVVNITTMTAAHTSRHGTSTQGLSFLRFPFILCAVMQCILVVSPASNLHKVQISATKFKSGAPSAARCLWNLQRRITKLILSLEVSRKIGQVLNLGADSKRVDFIQSGSASES